MIDINVPMRILFLVHSLRRGGAERVLLEIALGLRKKGHIVEVVSWLDLDEYGEEFYHSVPRHFLIRKEEYRWPWSVPLAAKRLRNVAAKFQPDVIEIHTPTVAWVAAWANLHVPCIHAIHGYGAIARRGSFKDWIMRKGDRLAHRILKADFIVPTSLMAEVASVHLAVDRSHFSCVPYGVDVNLFKRCSKMPDDAPTIMMLGTLSPHKGQQWGVRAISDILKQLPKAKLMIVGEGDYRSGLEALISGMGLEGKVVFMGRREDVPDLMSAVHAFWQLSESEGLGMVVLEAMATGLPVVGFDVRGTRDAIIEGETGYLVPFGDVRMVVQRTIALLNDGAAYKEMSRRARERVTSYFSMECMVDGHELVLHQVTAGKLHLY